MESSFPGTEPASPALEGGFLTTGLPGRSLRYCFLFTFLFSDAFPITEGMPVDCSVRDQTIRRWVKAKPTRNSRLPPFLAEGPHPRASDHTCPTASLPPEALLSRPLSGFPGCTRPGCAPAPFCSGRSAGHLGTSPFPLSFLQRSDFQTACSDFKIIEEKWKSSPTPLYLSRYLATLVLLTPCPLRGCGFFSHSSSSPPLPCLMLPLETCICCCCRAALRSGTSPPAHRFHFSFWVVLVSDCQLLYC